MSRLVTVLPEAEDEMLAAMRWYEGRRPGLGLEFLGAIEHVLARIASGPEQFALWPGDDRYRRAVLDRFPYLVVFEIRTEAIEVVAVAHARRDAGYWRERSPR